MKKRKSFKYLHHVDDEHERVYVHGGGFFATMSAKAAAKKWWPHHDIIIATEDLVRSLNGEDL